MDVLAVFIDRTKSRKFAGRPDDTLSADRSWRSPGASCARSSRDTSGSLGGETFGVRAVPLCLASNEAAALGRQHRQDTNPQESRSMRRRVQTLWAALVSASVALTGCHPTQPFFVHEDGDLSHYVDVATDIEYPDACMPKLADVEGAYAPLTLDNTDSPQMWDLTLEEAVQITLCNSKVMRSLGGRYASSAFNPRAQVGEAPDAIITNE